MKNVQLFLAFSLLAFLSPLFSQTTFAPLGAYWNYVYESHDGGYQEDQTIRVTHDTVIGNEIVKTLTLSYRTVFSLPPHPPGGEGVMLYGLLVVRGDSVFFREQWSPDQFLFDYAIVPGDTVMMNAGLRLFAVVDTQYAVNISGFSVKKWELQKYCDTVPSYRIEIVEDIGPVNDHLRYNQQDCLLGLGAHSFQCYSSSSLQYNTPCDPVVVGVEEKLSGKTSVKAWPNPTRGPLRIETNFPLLPDAEICLRDLSGRVLMKQDGLGAAELDLRDLPAGSYFLSLVIGGDRYSVKVLKMD